jgi:ParB/RepB/Spo0J family partition protein
LRIDQIQPNDYNPNQMSPEAFAELVAEVRHLGRLPKPVVVRGQAAPYTIVDGEHGWRAAREAGLVEIDVESVAVDDFEAMRQTWKRNQHGEMSPTGQGRMFRRMMEARQLSQRALAAEIGVSEGTIRNCLLYAEAAEVRNGYAFDAWTVRDIRAFLALPADQREAWLDGGSELARVEAELAPKMELAREAVNALFEIREKRLYRGTHTTFEAYCLERFGIDAEMLNLMLQLA